SSMKIYIAKIVELLSSYEEEFLKLFKDSKGICIPHFTFLLESLKNMINNQEIVKTIVEVEEKNLQRLKSELSEYIRRQGYEFSDLDRKDVEDVPLRSIQKIVGRRGLKSREARS
ncbi:MAG: DUF6062 family protein, partial [Candidatus Bathyarchaeia archaeon]